MQMHRLSAYFEELRIRDMQPAEVSYRQRRALARK